MDMDPKKDLEETAADTAAGEPEAEETEAPIEPETEAEDTTPEEASQEEPEEAEPQPTEEELKLRKEVAEVKDSYLRLMAEYENFRRRSAKEKEEISDTAKGTAVAEILPIIDNFERALNVETEDSAYKSGVEMIFKQFIEVLSKLGVEIIDPLGETFDPNIANAVNQIEDPELGENVVAQVFQKGYRVGGKIIRYAMVVVANP